MGMNYLLYLKKPLRGGQEGVHQAKGSPSKRQDAAAGMEATLISASSATVSAYELSGQKFPVLLQKAKEVADIDGVRLGRSIPGAAARIAISNISSTIDFSIYTLLRTSTVGNLTYLADFEENKRILHVGSHLACFNGGNWILGGKLLNNQTNDRRYWVEVGRFVHQRVYQHCHGHWPGDFCIHI
ncbi:hypothetical protein AB1N83_006013 [Pleurotus pulmonarius]